MELFAIEETCAFSIDSGVPSVGRGCTNDSMIGLCAQSAGEIGVGYRFPWEAQKGCYEIIKRYLSPLFRGFLGRGSS